LAVVVGLCLAIGLLVLIRQQSAFRSVRDPLLRALAPFAAFFAGSLLTGVDANREFYAVTAQVIPVLLLALGIEGRAFVLNRPAPAHTAERELFKIGAIGSFFFVAAGEIASLLALAQESPSPLLCGLAAGGLAAGFVSVALYSFGGFSAIDAEVQERDALPNAFLPTTKQDPELYCAFCGKPRRDVACLVQGGSGLICDECVSLCVDICDESKARRSDHASSDPRTKPEDDPGLE
jgi:hypothetical protein